MNGQSSEVIRCPNCKEDVPKTLYCLNCGYPLYKLEQKKTEEKIKEEEETAELELEAEPVDMSVEIEQTEPSQSTLPELEEEQATEEPMEQDQEPEPETMPEPEPTPEPEIATTIKVEEEVEPEPPVNETTLAEEEPSIVQEETQQLIEPNAEAEPLNPAESEQYVIEEVNIEFAPDPLTKEVIENLAKNITLKIRLIKLLRENQVKEETFKKLFDNYVEQGRLWVSRRDEIIRRFTADIERMERDLVSARKDFELLEIRKNIGDASDEEYKVKAPAYKWDIENLGKEIKNTRSGINYVINLQKLIPEEEIEELKAMSESNFSELDSIEGVSSDTIARMKEALYEALNILES